MNVNSRKQFPILQREGSVILENVSPDGEELPGTVGRLLIPGRIQTKISEISLSCTFLVLRQQQNLGQRFGTSKMYLSPPPSGGFGCCPF